MRIVYLNGFSSEKERIYFKEFVHHNVLDSLKNLIKSCDEFGYQLEEEFSSIGEGLRSMTPQFDTLIEEDRGQLLYKLWKSETIKKAYEQTYRYHLYDSDVYFLDNLETITRKDYVPSVHDILKVRVKTTGIKETEFNCRGFNFSIADVGGQRSERRKWIHCFYGVTAIIFVVALNDYERILEEDLKTNRMMESIQLFKETINNRFFQETNIILFLNKKDIFSERLKVTPLTKCFEDYTGGEDYGSAVEFITKKFLQQNKSNDRCIYYHETDATDTNNFKMVWNAVQEIAVRGALIESNLL
eukprot:TRINITY_DN1506_c0_g1_i2.p1 TRINITY_DN1506_c0_g1~~TRINITY_DN1506_c0_g1_i2.p1  ORF type:complete len:301 (+),score=61.56 TRINITY_DN1506_c0_g1_i2:73-975(+)